MDANEAKMLAALLIAACIAAVILVFFIVTLLRYHRKNVALYRDKLRAEIETLESERRRIVNDLHDELSPVLSSVKLQVSVLEPVSEVERLLIGKVADNIDIVLENIRSISNDLVPNVLLRKGLGQAIKEFVDGINDAGLIKISVHFKATIELPPEKQVHIFRIVKEALNNSLRHSGARHARVKVTENGLMMRLEISDNGSGYEQGAGMRANSGRGLQNIYNRVELLKGVMAIDTNPGKGTHFIIDIPIIDDKRKN